MIRSREDIALANRIVLKAGTSVVSTPDGYPSLSRMANIVEHAAKLVREGKEVLIVTSGAVGVGRQKLSKQAILRRSMSDLIIQREYVPHIYACFQLTCCYLHAGQEFCRQSAEIRSR